MSGLFIGTSGWNYDHWKNRFYTGIKRKDWLWYYAGQFDTVEVNASFYRLLKPETLKRWREQTSDRFRFALKGNRYLTHNKKLKDPAASIELERDNARALGRKLSVVLWQLPAHMKKDIGRLQAFCEALSRWSKVRHAIEFRHPSWFGNETAQCLRNCNIANCQSDAADWPLWTAVTTDLVYVRLHGHTRTYASAYRKSTLMKWAEAVVGWRKEDRIVHVYFDNDAEGSAPEDARKLKRLVETM